MNPVHPKTIAGGTSASIGGSVAVLVIWILGQRGVIIPPDVAASISAIATFVFGIVASYLAPSYAGDPSKGS